jgi:hypothetical protein
MEELARFYLNYTIGPCGSCAGWYFTLVPAERIEASELGSTRRDPYVSRSRGFLKSAVIFFRNTELPRAQHI